MLTACEGSGRGDERVGGKSGGELGEEAGRSETVHAGPLISARATLPGS